MAIQKFKMFVVVGTGDLNHGRVRLADYEPNSTDVHFSARLLKEIEVETDVPDFDLNQLEIDSLEKAVESERADSQMRVNILLDRISKLKCITHEAAE